MEEGYIKYKCHLTERELEHYPEMNEINAVRSELVKLNMIGVYPSGISFGNISIRLSGERFIITGTQTGAFNILLPEHFTIVKEADIKRNAIECVGLRPASSESLTHSAFYKSSEDINSVIHIHNLSLWKKLLFKVPTIPDTCEYGTTEIAEAVSELINTNMQQQSGVIALAGHFEGIVSYGFDLYSAYGEIKKYL